MAIEGIGEFDDMMYYKGMSHACDDPNVKKADTLLQTKITELFKIETCQRRLPTSINNRDIKSLMVKVAYSEKDKDGKEKKVEVTVDTRDGPKDAPSKDKDSSKSEDKKDKDQGK